MPRRLQSMMAALGPPILLVLAGCASPAPHRTVLPPADRSVPWSVSENAPVLHGRESETSEPTNGFEEFGYRVYSQHITQMDGPRCEHSPSCSRYAVEAIRGHGFFVGLWLAMDRLVRGDRSSALRKLPLESIEGGKLKFSDPVSNNDFFH